MTDVPDTAGPGRAGTPLTPAGVAQLLFRPSRFFDLELHARHGPTLVAIAWLAGMDVTIGRIDQAVLRSQMGMFRPGLGPASAALMDSWLVYWTSVAVLGALSGLLVWYLGGWWYRTRLRWSGAERPDPDLARRTFLYATLIGSAPSLLWSLAATLRFPDYASTWDDQSILGIVLLVFPFWSVVVSYRGVRSRFAVGRWRALVWFLILPVLVYALILGVVATLAALATPASSIRV